MNGHILQFAVAAGEATPDARRLRMIGVFSRRRSCSDGCAQQERPPKHIGLDFGTN
jgi:hypothetical protein